MTVKSVLMRPGACTPTCYATSVARGYPAPWGRGGYLCAPTNKNCRIWSEELARKKQNRIFAIRSGHKRRPLKIA